MKTISKNTTSIPGLLDILAIPISQIISIRDNTLTLVQNPQTYYAEGTLDSQTQMVRTVNSNAGTYYNGRFGVFVPGQNPANAPVIEEMTNRYYAVVYTDYNNNSFIFGNKNAGLAFEFVQRDQPRKGIEATFAGDTTTAPVPIFNIVEEGQEGQPVTSHILTLETNPNNPAFVATGAGSYLQGTPVQINTFVHVYGKTYKFSSWSVVSGTTPTGFAPGKQSQTIILLSDCTLRANWVPA